MFPAFKKTVFFFLLALGCYIQMYAQQKPRYLFFFHNKFVEEVDLKLPHPEYGLCEYDHIVNTFKQNGFTVITEKRPRNADVKQYAQKTVKQIDSLLKTGIKPSDITVVGTSKGSFIAMTVSNMLKNQDVNFVLIGCCWNGITAEMPDMRFYGNILSIYERSDSLGQSCMAIKNKSNGITKYRELVLNTDMKHGYLYKALEAWMQPAMQWAKANNIVDKGITYSIDSLLNSRPEMPFNGIIIISQNGATRYGKCNGYSDIEQKKPLLLNDRFFIGSISKQMTAVLVLREYELGRLKLHVPIRRYLPDLKQSWADTITVHNLLVHMHGIKEPKIFSDEAINTPDAVLSFRPGTQYAYSQIGYKLLADIVEKTSGKSFASLSEELFKQCGMQYTHHPTLNGDSALVKRYIGTSMDNLKPETQNINSSLVAAGGFISSVFDLVRWNEHLFGGKLLADSTYNLMVTQHPGAVRQHPLFGETRYGYGITVDKKEGLLQLGQTGKIPASLSMNFYFPATKTSLVILSNIELGTNPETTFYYHMGVLNIVRQSIR